jgi:hypothetical protein
MTLADIAGETLRSGRATLDLLLGSIVVGAGFGTGFIAVMILANAISGLF